MGMVRRNVDKAKRKTVYLYLLYGIDMFNNYNRSFQNESLKWFSRF